MGVLPKKDCVLCQGSEALAGSLSPQVSQSQPHSGGAFRDLLGFFRVWGLGTLSPINPKCFRIMDSRATWFRS